MNECSFCKDFSFKNHGNFIHRDKEGKFNIILSGHPCQWRCIENVKYCPYCGSKLGIMFNLSIAEQMKEKKDDVSELDS